VAAETQVKTKVSGGIILFCYGTDTKQSQHPANKRGQVLDHGFKTVLYTPCSLKGSERGERSDWTREGKEDRGEAECNSLDYIKTV